MNLMNWLKVLILTMVLVLAPTIGAAQIKKVSGKGKSQVRILGTLTNRFKMVNKYVLVAKRLSDKELVKIATKLHRAEPKTTFFFLDDAGKSAQMLKWIKDYAADKAAMTDPIFKWMTEHIVANLQEMTGGGRGKYWALSKGMWGDEIAEIK